MVSLLLAVIYLSFISLGLPDSLLGAAWPSMFPELGVSVSYAGIISLIIAASTILSSLFCDRLTKKLGTGKVTAISVALTAVAMLGFSFSDSFLLLCLWSLPYGLGAGCVDAALNNYVALHYASRHMSWLHCMWGVGASLGPYIMGRALTGAGGWGAGYRYVGIIQLALTLILILALPLWKKSAESESAKSPEAPPKALKLREVIKTPGAKAAMITFFCYCGLEQTAALWVSSYLTLHSSLSAEAAAGYAALFFIGITAGRALSGFLTMRLGDSAMIRLGLAVTGTGIILLLLPLGTFAALTGLVLLGLGCAPIFPCMIHSTPAQFGADRSQAIIGAQMASGYAGACTLPPLFGLIAEHISASLFPVYLVIILLLMVGTYHLLLKTKAAH